MRTLDQGRSFLDGAEPVEVRPLDRGAGDEFVARTLRRFRYGSTQLAAMTFAFELRDEYA